MQKQPARNSQASFFHYMCRHDCHEAMDLAQISNFFILYNAPTLRQATVQ